MIRIGTKSTTVLCVYITYNKALFIALGRLHIEITLHMEEKGG